MKILSTLVLSLCLLAACQDGTKKSAPAATDAKHQAAPKKEMAAKSSNVTTKMNVMPGSKVYWSGSKLAGTHTGTLDVSAGSIDVTNGAITGGSVTIDMNSLTVTDLEAGKGKEDLEGHLKSPDFFDVAKHPTATFEVTGATNGSITGNLTMNGVTKPVAIPGGATIIAEGMKMYTEEFKINRTDWGLKYGSGSFMDLAKDKIIADEIGIKIDLKAKS